MALIHTSCGDIKLDLWEKTAPRAVSNFLFLAREDFYDGLTFHQVVVDFIVQAGDPNGLDGNPPDGPGYTLKDELPRSNQDYTHGVLGMANTGESNSSGSQFLIVVHDYEGAQRGDPKSLRIRPHYTVFGRVLPSFYGSVESIARQVTHGGTDEVESVKPILPIYIEDIEILRQN